MPKKRKMCAADREEVGLSFWPMSSSYPVTRPELEARKMLRKITTSRKQETEVVLNTNLPDSEQSNTKKKGCCNIFSLCCLEQPEPKSSVDDVDGLDEDLLGPLVKLLFLKILLVDIGISLGDVLTDLLQGLSLLFDAEWNIQWSTYHYGLAVLGVLWIPGLAVLSYQASGAANYKILTKERHWLGNFFVGLLFLLCFPLVPTILYIRLLLYKRAFRTSKEKLVFLQQEATSHEVKAIAGALESPLEVILLLWLLLRGILKLSSTGIDSSCIGDSLGRAACFPSLPVASIIFSLLSVLKTLCDINISPIISSMNEAHSVVKLSYNWQLMAQFGPFFVCNVQFRTVAFAFIVTFLDFWTIIPLILVLLLNLVHTTLVCSDSPKEEDTKDPEQQEDNNDPGSILDRVTEDRTVEDDCRSSCSQDEEKLLSRPIPILLSSVLCILLPIAYSPHTHGTSGPRGKLGAHVEIWARIQARILRSQALVVNTCTLIVVIVIYCLVNHTSSFNYKSNILTPWWFKIVFSYLLLLYTLCLPLSWFMEFPIVRRDPKNQPAEAIETRSRHPTDQSSRVSVHSASSRLVSEEEGPAQLGFQVTISLLITFLVVTPSIVGTILFKTQDNNGYQALQVKEQDGGLLHRHLTHLTIINPGWRPAPVANSFIVGCDGKEKLKNSVLLVNFSIPECRRLYRRMTPGLFGLNQPRAVVILDDTPETGWRVSSPPNNQVLMDPSLPVFSAKVVDWSQGWRASRVEIVRENERLAPSEFSCSEDRDVFIGEARYYEKCNRMKRLHEDGRITETRSTCLLYTIKINISLQVYEDVLL